MASTELLASKVVILEEEPNIPSITALPSAVCLCEGITERGPIADRALFTSNEEYQRKHGGFTADSEVAIAAWGFFYQGGSFMWVSRTCHFTDINDPATYTAATGSVMLQNAGTADLPAVVTGVDVAPYNLEPGQHIDIDIGAGPVVATFNATHATVLAAATFPVGPAIGGEYLEIRVKGANQNQAQRVTAVGGETTLVDFLNLFNSQVKGARFYDNGAGAMEFENDIAGTDSELEVTDPGTLNALVGIPYPGVASGTGNVANIDQVTQSEVEAVVEGAIAGCDAVANIDGTMTFQTVALGATETIQVDAASTVDFGCDNDVHSGSDANPEDTLLVEGKTPGAYANVITTIVAAASNGQAAYFNFQVLSDGVVKESFPNVNMDATSTDYIEARVNDVNLGSNLVAVTDQGLAYTALLKRPANGTSSAMTGGDDGLAGIVDIDYIGSEAGPTGLYCFDRVSTGRILIIPGASTEAIHKGMMDYAEVHRNGTMFCVLDPPEGLTAVGIKEYVVDTAAILEYSEYAAIYWPRIKVTNPSTAVFGSDDAITIPPSGWIAGLYAKNDQQIGGVYESPAGVGFQHPYGVIRGMLGVEDDPGGAEQHEVLDERKRDFIYPYRINPITRLEGTPWHIDGGRTLKSTGNFPNVGERRGVIFIETTLQQSLVIFKHRFNNHENRMRAKRIITVFLTREMNKNAFRSKDPNTAFFVDASDALNPLANELAGVMTIRIGLATNKPTEFLVLLVTQDTRALDEQLAA